MGELMPKLLLFGACEKVLIGADDNSMSLITIITEVTLRVPFPVGTKIPDNTVLPLTWFAFALWAQEPGEGNGQVVEQRVELATADGTSLLSTDVKFEMQKPYMRVKIPMPEFPVAESGSYTLRLSVRSDSGVWTQVSDYPIIVLVEQAPGDVNS